MLLVSRNIWQVARNFGVSTSVIHCLWNLHREIGWYKTHRTWSQKKNQPYSGLIFNPLYLHCRTYAEKKINYKEANLRQKVHVKIIFILVSHSFPFKFWSRPCDLDYNFILLVMMIDNMYTDAQMNAIPYLPNKKLKHLVLVLLWFGVVDERTNFMVVPGRTNAQQYMFGGAQTDLRLFINRRPNQRMGEYSIRKHSKVGTKHASERQAVTCTGRIRRCIFFSFY